MDMDQTSLIPPNLPTIPEMSSDDDVVFSVESANLDDALIDRAAERVKRAGEDIISVDDLDDENKERSVQLAREILEKLKVQIGASLIEHGLHDLPVETNELLSDMSQLTDLFDYYISTARAMDDQFMHDSQVLAAIDASDALTYQMVKAAMRAAKEHDEEEEIEQMRAHMQMLGKQAKDPTEETFGELINKMEMGIQKAQARLEALGTRDTFGQSGRSAADAMSIGAHKDNEKKTNKIQATNFNDDYTKQLMARKMARMAIVKQLQAQKAMQRNLRNQKMLMANKDTAPEPKAGALDKLLSPQQIEQMRATMATALGATPVEAGTVKDTIKQVKNTHKQQQVVRQQIEMSKRGTNNRQDIQENQLTQKEPPARPQKQGRGF